MHVCLRAAQKDMFQPSGFKALRFVRPTIYPDLLLTTSMQHENVTRPGLEKMLPVDIIKAVITFSFKTYLAKQISCIETCLLRIWLE